MEKIAGYTHKLLNYFATNNSFDLSSSWLRLLVLLIAVITLSYFVNLLLSGSVLGKGYRIFVAPGIILHELSHSLFCLLTGAKITKISLFDKEGGSVEHTESKIPVLGPILISLAPFAFGIGAIFAIAKWLGIKETDFNWTGWSFQDIILFLNNLKNQINFSNYQNWLVLYFALSIAVTMTPSRQDIKNIALILILLIAGFYLLIRFAHLNLPLSFVPIDKAILLLNTVVILLIFCLILSIIIFALSKIFSRH